MDDRRSSKVELDEILNNLLLTVARQLLIQVEAGESIKPAIDFLRLHKRSLPECEVIGSSQDPNEYLDSLVEDLDLENKKRGTRR